MARGRNNDNILSLRHQRYSAALQPFHSWRQISLNQPYGGWEHVNKTSLPKGYVIFDTETTGLNPDKGARIIQLALRLIDPQGTELLRYETYIDPEESIPAESADIHGITDDMVAQAPRFHDVWPKIEQLFRENVWVAHNLDFDQRMLESEVRRIGETTAPVAGRSCTLQFARLSHPHASHKLDQCISRLGIEPDQSMLHDAGYDTWACMQLVLALIGKNIAPESVWFDDKQYWRKRNSEDERQLRTKDWAMLLQSVERTLDVRSPRVWVTKALESLDQNYDGGELTLRDKQLVEDYLVWVKMRATNKTLARELLNDDNGL
jgi:DNA polymerase-3 subunit epsilon